jgi:hypothetical protein
MLQIHTANLTPDQQRRLHRDFVSNERVYLQMRSSLLAQYRGQWVAVDAGNVVAAGPNLMNVMERASTVAQHPYVALVGAEDDVVFRLRPAAFAYDQAYHERSN